MRFAENRRNGKLEWLIRKGRLHALRRPRLPEVCPSPGAIIQYKTALSDFHQENCIGCGYCVSGCPFNALPEPGRQQGL